MVTVPPVMPKTTPVAEPTVAILVAELPHMPPAIEFVRVIVNAGQTFTSPDIAANGLTVTTVDTVHPVPTV